MYYPKSPRRKRERAESVDLFVAGPEPIISAFLQFRQEEGHTSHWSALEDLLRRAGVLDERDAGACISTNNAINSRDFVANFEQAKEAAQNVPVTVLEDDNPAYVFVNHKQFMKLAAFRRSVAAALDQLDHIDAD